MLFPADGGTRTASINGAWVATRIALNKLLNKGILKNDPMKFGVSAISCGSQIMYLFLDLDYYEDSNADADANFVFNNLGEIIEINALEKKNLLVVRTFQKCLSYQENLA